MSFRIEALKLSGQEVITNGNLKKVKTGEQVKKTMSEFIQGKLKPFGAAVKMQ